MTFKCKKNEGFHHARMQNYEMFGNCQRKLREKFMKRENICIILFTISS